MSVPGESTTFRARHFQSGRWVRGTVAGAFLSEWDHDPDAPAADESPADAHDWVAPAFWDIQTNGRAGVSYSDPTVTAGQVAEVVRAQAGLGSARVCPTLITAPFDSFVTGLQAIASACEEDPAVGRMVAGVHLEGPYISPVDGYRGAHPYDSVRSPDWDEFRRFQDAAGGRIVLMTLAPELPGALDFIRRAVASGVIISLGHTCADGATLRVAADAGATLSTHLGNGIASPLPRHPNPIWEQASLDGLSASFIADGHHLDAATLKVLVRAKMPRRVILVSDASPLAGLPPGEYGGWAVHPSGKIVVKGTHYLAGSNHSLVAGLNLLMTATGYSTQEAIATVTRHPALLLRRIEPVLSVGHPANLVIYRLRSHRDGEAPSFQLLRTCVDGRWVEAENLDPSGE